MTVKPGCHSATLKDLFVLYWECHTGHCSQEGLQRGVSHWLVFVTGGPSNSLLCFHHSADNDGELSMLTCLLFTYPEKRNSVRPEPTLAHLLTAVSQNLA